MFRKCTLGIVIILIMSGSLWGGVPQLISYQGLVKDSSGTPLNGSFAVTFRLYSYPDSGIALWTEAHTAVSINGGLFNVSLGSVSAFAGIEPEGDEIWLGITIGGDTEISPRAKWVSVPFAFQADHADTANFAFQAKYVDTANFAYQAGNVDTADFAFQAKYTDTADFAYQAGFVDTANFSYQAGSTDSAGFSSQAKYADTAGYSFGSLWADTANYALSSKLSDTAEYAHTSGSSDSAAVALSVADNAVGSAQLIDNSVSSADIEDSTIIGSDIATETISGSHLALGSVSSSKIADGTIQLVDFGNMGASEGKIIKWNSSSASWVIADDSVRPAENHGWTDNGSTVTLTFSGDSVGIGTLIPSSKLDVEGNVKVSGKISSSGLVSVTTDTATAISGRTTGAGMAGFFRTDNNGAHAAPTLRAEHFAQIYGYLASDLYGVYGMYEPNNSFGYLGGDFIGVYGSSLGSGVSGYSASGSGVRGETNGGKALYGSCGPLGYGLFAESQAQTHGSVASNLYGVYGMYEPNSSWGYLGGDATGVYGTSTVRGVSGFSASGYGVSGETIGGKALYGSCGPLGFGLFAESQAQTHGYVASNLYGVYGMYEPNSSWGYLGGDATGVYGTSTGTGVLGTSIGGIGVYGESSGGYGVYGVVVGTGWAGSFIASGDSAKGVTISTSGGQGLQVIGGAKSAVLSTSDGARAVYCEEATEVWLNEYGFGRLSSGVVTINVASLFLEIANTEIDYHVFVQSYGDAEIYVERRDPTSFTVKIRSGDPNVEFSFRIVAKRKGFEQKRLERTPWADDDPNLVVR